MGSRNQVHAITAPGPRESPGEEFEHQVYYQDDAHESNNHRKDYLERGDRKRQDIEPVELDFFLFLALLFILRRVGPRLSFAIAGSLVGGSPIAGSSSSEQLLCVKPPGGPIWLLEPVVIQRPVSLGHLQDSFDEIPCLDKGYLLDTASRL